MSATNKKPLSPAQEMSRKLPWLNKKLRARKAVLEKMEVFLDGLGPKWIWLINKHGLREARGIIAQEAQDLDREIRTLHHFIKINKRKEKGKK